MDPADPARRTIGALAYLGGLVLDGDAAQWGGYSGLIVDPDGTLLAVSDTGYWLEARLVEGADGSLLGLAEARLHPLLGRDGRPLTGKMLGDAEALSRDAEGGLLVAFEREHRIWRYADPRGARPTAVEAPEGMADLPRNSGIEAMAALPGNRLLLISEGVQASGGGTLGWLRQDGRWHAVTLAPHGGFQPSDMALLPNGDVLLLERHFSLFDAMAVRLSIIPAADIRPGARLKPREIARIGEPMTVDNFEAVAARRAPDGGVIIDLLSDDNGNPLQRTLLLQFRLTPAD